jgi:hypothetical protein
MQTFVEPPQNLGGVCEKEYTAVLYVTLLVIVSISQSQRLPSNCYVLTYVVLVFSVEDEDELEEEQDEDHDENDLTEGGRRAVTNKVCFSS